MNISCKERMKSSNHSTGGGGGGGEQLHLHSNFWSFSNIDLQMEKKHIVFIIQKKKEYGNGSVESYK